MSRTAYSYIRFSSKIQEKGDSLRRQTEAAERFCAKHGLTLASKNYQDLGVSAFVGENSQEGQLSAFLQAVQLGRIAKGSVLVVEELDRISRDDVMSASAVFEKILKAGIDIGVCAKDRIYTKSDFKKHALLFLEIAFGFITAHEESAKKSERLSAVWGERKANAAGKVVTSRVPNWLTVVGKARGKEPQRIEPIPHRVAVIQDIFNKAAKEGWGIYRITKYLNAELKEPTWGGGQFWQDSYVKKILNNRAVLGEYQPHTRRKQAGNTRTPTGEVVPNYFPAIIDAHTFNLAQQGLKSRKLKAGRPSKEHYNLFSHILRCGYTKTPIRYLDKTNDWKYLAPAACVTGVVDWYMSWNYQQFEELFFQRCLSAQYLDIQHLKDEDAQKTEGNLQAKVAAQQNVLARLVEAVKTASNIPQLVTAMGEEQAKLNTLQMELKAHQEAHAQFIQNDFHEFIEQCQRKPDIVRNDDELRTRFRSILMEKLECIELYFEGQPTGYIEHRSEIHRILTKPKQANKLAYRKLVEARKHARFIVLKYKNGSQIMVPDVPLLETLEDRIRECPGVVKHLLPRLN
jgi:DNA invertase Pin-like site-specific DNA recombinase